MTYLLLYPLPSITLATLLWIRAARQERESKRLVREENEVAAFRRWLEGVDVDEFERRVS